WNNLNISGLTSLSFSGLFGATTGVWLTGDYIKVLYRINSDVDPFSNLLWFSDDAGNDLSVDTNFDGTGEGVSKLGLALQNFTASIPGTGTTLDLRIEFHSQEGGQTIALDTIGITGTSVTTPEAGSTLWLLGLGLGVLYLVRRSVASPA